MYFIPVAVARVHHHAMQYNSFMRTVNSDKDRVLLTSASHVSDERIRSSALLLPKYKSIDGNADDYVEMLFSCPVDGQIRPVDDLGDQSAVSRVINVMVVSRHLHYSGVVPALIRLFLSNVQPSSAKDIMGLVPAAAAAPSGVYGLDGTHKCAKDGDQTYLVVKTMGENAKSLMVSAAIVPEHHDTNHLITVLKALKVASPGFYPRIWMVDDCVMGT